MKQPPTAPQITTLRKFVVNHTHIDFLSHVHHLSRWVRRITFRSHLEHLELVMDNFEYFRGPYLNYGGLVEHISYKHGGSLRVLRLTHGYIDSTTIALLCQQCPNLEEISLGVSMSTLVGFPSTVRSCSDLTRGLPAARIPPKGRPVIKTTPGCLPNMQHEIFSSPEIFHRRSCSRLL
jgi:hypothetical protein